MGRNIVRRDTSEAAPPGTEGARLADGTPVDRAPLQGGTSGEPPDPNPKSVHVHGLDNITPARDVTDAERLRAPKRYRVTGGPDSVMYEGQKVRNVIGRIIPENAVNMDLLRRQGVQFEEVEEAPQ